MGEDEMGEVIERDFGKEDREFARKFARLMKLVEEREADILANPGKYLDMASKKIIEQELFFRSLEDALRGPGVSVTREDSLPDRLEPTGITVPKEKWERLRRVEQLIRTKL